MTLGQERSPLLSFETSCPRRGKSDPFSKHSLVKRAVHESQGGGQDGGREFRVINMRRWKPSGKESSWPPSVKPSSPARGCVCRANMAYYL